MPLYTYLNLTTGTHESHMRTIAERDTLRGYERIFEAPRNLLAAPCKGSVLTQQAQQVLEGYKTLEARGQLKKSRAEAAHIRDAWKDATETNVAADEHAHTEQEKREGD